MSVTDVVTCSVVSFYPPLFYFLVEILPCIFAFRGLFNRLKIVLVLNFNHNWVCIYIYIYISILSK